ncbi:MAG TPA: hypothetical protein PK089_09845, partial [Methanoregulaceae archaeon]|nr:hypothetical protein [Methanoregulaceae archaeon]
MNRRLLLAGGAILLGVLAVYLASPSPPGPMTWSTDGVRISPDGSNPLYPAISGDLVAWEEHGIGKTTQIGVFSLADHSTRLVSPHPWIQFTPSVWQDRVVWQDKRNGNWDIFLFNLTTGVETPVCIHPAKQSHPVISGDRIVWVDERNGDPDIYLFDLATGTERPICVQPQTQYDPDIDGEVVVWEDYREGYETAGDIYAFDLGTGKEMVICREKRGQ